MRALFHKLASAQNNSYFTKCAFWPFSRSKEVPVEMGPEGSIKDFGDEGQYMSLGPGVGMDMGSFYEYCNYCDNYPHAMEAFNEDKDYNGPALSWPEIVEKYGTPEEVAKLRANSKG